MPVEIFLEMEDNFERNVWISIADKVLEHRRIIDENRAILIANAVGKMFK